MRVKSCSVTVLLGMALLAPGVSAQATHIYGRFNSSTGSAAKVAKFREVDLGQVWIRDFPQVMSLPLTRFAVADGQVYAQHNTTSSTGAKLAKYRESDFTTTWVKDIPLVQSFPQTDFAVADGYIYGRTALPGLSAKISKYREGDFSVVWIRDLPQIQATPSRAFSVHEGHVYVLTNTTTSSKMVKYREADFSQVWIRDVPLIQSFPPEEIAVFRGSIYTQTITSATAKKITKFRESDFGQVWSRDFPLLSSFPNHEFGLDFGSIAASLVPYGSACSGSAGLPIVSNVGLPVIGTTFDASLSRARSFAPSVFVIGATPGSISLAALGSPNCNLLVALSGSLAVMTNTTSTGTASVPVSVPRASSLLGGTFVHQFLVLDSTYVSASTGVQGVIGNQ